MKPILLAAIVPALVAIMFATEGRAMSDSASRRLHLATNHYSWLVYYSREGKDFNASLDEGFAAIASCGLDGFEPMIESPADAERFGAALKKRGLAIRSLYVNTTLHDGAEAEKSIAHVLAIATAAKKQGTQIIVTNPNPIRWGGAEDKSDEQLRTQAKALNTLGRRLADMGLTLAYHNHDIELRQSAREFHHMMVGTDPKCVKLCLDAQWIYRGSGNSAVALFDIVEHYGRRVAELHLRQSQGGVWAEEFGDGDIDYKRLAAKLASLGVKPHLVLEQAVETGTPKTITTVEAHRRSAEYARGVFGSAGQ